MFGLANELAGAGGFSYNARHGMTRGMLKSGIPAMEEVGQRFAKAYGYSEAASAKASRRMGQNLAVLTGQLEGQKAKGSRYFIGESLSALDLIWASFSNCVRPLPEDVNPMPAHMRATWQRMSEKVDSPEILFEHRGYIYETYLTLPLDF